MLWSPQERLRLGMTIKTPTSLKLDGETKGDVPGSWSQDTIFYQEIPWYFNTGIAYQVTPNFLVSAEFDYKLWSQVKQSVKDAGPLGVSYEDSHYEDSYIASIGSEYLMGKFVLRGGLSYVSSTLEEDYISPMTPNETPWVTTTLGLGYNVTEDLEIGLSFSKFFLDDVTNAAGENLDGDVIIATLGINGSF